MNWFLPILVFVGLLGTLMCNDYTSRYAELASPLPSNMDANTLVSSLRSAHNHE